MAEFTHKGIKYISDSNGYFRDSLGNHYLKYKPPTAISTSSGIELSPQHEYYVYRYINQTVTLSLSHTTESNKTIGAITKDQFHQGISMPAAKIRFNPNGGTMVSGTKGSDEFYVVSGKEDVTESAMALSGLVTRSGYTQTSWRVGHIGGAQISDFSSINLHANYPITYPQTEILLVAEWKDAEIDVLKYTISFYANGSPFGSSQEFTYNPSKTINLKTGTPTKDGYLFSGWILKNSDSTSEDDALYPDYGPGSEFFCNKKSNVRLSALWRKRKLAFNYPVTFNLNGGREGLGNTILGALLGDYWNLPGSDSNINAGIFTRKNGLPRKRGYSFSGWDNGKGDTLHPGHLCYYLERDKNLTASWYTNPQIESSIPTDSSKPLRQIPYHICDGHIRMFQIKPSYTATYTITGIRSVSSHQQIIRIIDSKNTELMLSNKSKNITNTNSASVVLEKDQEYFLEISGLKGTNGGFTIYKTPVSRTASIDPLGGTYYTSSGDATSTATHSHIFKTDKTYVGISTSSTKGTGSDFTGDGTLTPATYPGQPFKQGFWFNKWICSDGLADIQLRNFTNANLYTTNYVPSIDFGAYANWIPNRCYVIYDGNNHREGNVPTLDLQHNIAEKVYQNLYKKYSDITYNSRGGTYNLSTDWTQPGANVLITDNSNSEIKKIQVNHTFSKWNDKSDGSGKGYSPGNNITLKDTTTQNQGITTTLYAIWTINTVKLPSVERAGFEFMGWYDSEGARVGGIGDIYSYADPEITLYAHWQPIGLVQIYTNDGWKQAIPYIYTYNNTTKTYEWKRAMSYVYNGSEWKQGAGSGQNMTNEQLEDL